MLMKWKTHISQYDSSDMFQNVTYDDMNDILLETYVDADKVA